MKIFRQDISQKKEFKFENSILKQLEFNGKRYLYGRYHINGELKGMLFGYEIVQPVPYKNPDGTTVLVYPSPNQFGRYGWSLPCTAQREWIDDIMNNVPKKEWRRKTGKVNQHYGYLDKNV